MNTGDVTEVPWLCRMLLPLVVVTTVNVPHVVIRIAFGGL